MHAKANPGADRDSTYRVIAISLYHEDLAKLEAHKAALRAHGWKASRSEVIRLAVAQLDIEALRKGAA